MAQMAQMAQIKRYTRKEKDEKKTTTTALDLRAAAKNSTGVLREGTAESDGQKARALRGYRKLGTVSGACRASGIGRRTWYNWLERDREFFLSLAAMKADVADELEAEAMRRAKGGDGSDRLLIFLLKAFRPEKFRDNAQITNVSPIVREKVRQTVRALRASLPKEVVDPILERLHEIWQ